MTSRFASALSALFLLASIAAQPSLARDPEVFRYFDLDDTVARFPSPNVIFNKVTGEEKLISSREWRDIRNFLEKPGEWQDWFKIETREWKSTFRYNIDHPGKNMFVEAIEKGLKQPAEVWQARAWKDFQYMCETPEGARRVGILTARGHAPESLRQGLMMLKERGLIKHIPPLKNLRPVYHLSVNPADIPLHEAKAAEIRKKLNALQREARRRGPEARAVFEFADDAAKNVDEAVRMIRAEAEAAGGNPWPQVSILLREIKERGDDVLERIEFSGKEATRLGLTRSEFDQALHWASPRFSASLRACATAGLQTQLRLSPPLEN